MKRALLLSGGMDSCAIAYWLRPEIAITIDYGQCPAAGEIRAAKAITEALSIKHVVVVADLSLLGSGDMAGSAPLAAAPVSEWWPFRNQMLATIGAMKAIALGVDKLLIGSLKTDSRHADGKAEFVQALSKLLNMQEGKMEFEAPAIELTAVDLIKKSGVPYDILRWAHSCHVGEYACGMCGGCQKHYETLEALGETPY